MDLHNLIAHQINVEDGHLVRGEVVKEDLRVVNLYGLLVTRIFPRTSSTLTWPKHVAPGCKRFGGIQLDALIF